MTARDKTTDISQAADARVEIRRLIGDISDFKIMHNMILVATYIEPEKTAGGIWKPQTTVDESKWQGKVGLVLKKGPIAFKDDDVVKYHGQDVQEDEWVYYRSADGWPLLIHGVHCRMLEDVNIKGVVPHPEYIY